MTRRIEYAFLFAVLALALAAFCVFSRVALADGSGNENTANESSNHQATGDQGAGDEGSGDEGAGNEGQALGFSQGQETEIQVGSVVGSATLRDSMCVIHTPIKIGARVQNGSSPLAISWRFDEQCRAVVYDIQPNFRSRKHASAYSTG